MVTRRKIEIVFRRKVRAIWLEQGMALAAKGETWKNAKQVLNSQIAAENPGAVTVSKVLEHIRRVWFEPPEDSQALRTDAFRILHGDDTQNTRLLLNWGMTIAAYPFVGSTGEALGRLLKLQNEAHRADVQRRLREQYGDRDFVSRIARYNISSFLDWGIIKEAKPKGVYLLAKQARPKNGVQLAWLTEAILISSGESQMSFSKLSHHPILFPIAVEALSASLLLSNPRLRVARQGLNEDVVSLATR